MTEQLNLLEARTRRDAGISKVNTNADDDFASACRDAIQYLADRGVPFTSDDVRRLVDLEPHHDNAWGGQVSAAVKSGVIVRVGSRQTRRPKAHARWVGLYEGASS